jgi:hypothetical protein
MTYPSKNITKDHLEKSRKGGLSGKGKPKLRVGKRCTDKCPAYSKGCIYATISKTEHSGYCALVLTAGNASKPFYELVTASKTGLIQILARDLFTIRTNVTDANTLLKIWDRFFKLIELIIGRQMTEDEEVDMKFLFDKMGQHLQELEEKHSKEIEKAMEKR